jgi:hypothetical protein
MTKVLDAERHAFSQIVELAPLHVMVVKGPDLTVAHLNERFSSLVNGAAVEGRPMADVLEELGLASLIDVAREVYHREQRQVVGPLTHHVQGETRRSIYTIAPIRDGERHVGGLVIYGFESDAPPGGG